MRLVQRSSILALASAVALSTAACGGGSSDDTTVNQAGVMHTFVVDQVLLPTKPGDGTKYGLDLDGDGNVDNALGSILSALTAAAGSGNLNLQGSIDDSVQQGKIILLANLKSTDPVDMATGVALEIFVGANPNPQPCVDPNNPTPTTCGQHLKGTASFTIDPAGPQDAQIVGKTIGSQFTGGPGTVTLEITLSSTVGAPIQLSLIGARAKVPGVSATALGSAAAPGIIAGAITQDDLNTKVLPAVQTTVSMQIDRDCGNPPAGPPPGCGCKSGSTGATVINLFDKDASAGCPDCVKDCKVTLEEIKESDLIKTLLAPDVNINGQMALSVGVGVTAVPATFPVPAGK